MTQSENENLRLFSCTYRKKPTGATETGHLNQPTEARE